ncbi:unnamed protein product [Strongylus vulgaris]|uniref:Myb/SANT-like DNA-binding domain-containing protein n=1 Tax=Strongylus vulgaris TaxID=40348 RepID=A0A3P7J790_STRVU|nr:unnamed protein product [Strongylus vulgaris]
MAWDKIFVKMKNKGYDRNIDELKRMWRNMRTAYMRHKAGSTRSPASDGMPYFKNSVAALKGSLFSNRFSTMDFSDSDLNLDDTSTGPSTSCEAGSYSCIPVLGDKTNNVSSALKRRRSKLCSDDVLALRTATEAVKDRLVHLNDADKFTHFRPDSNYVASTLRNLPEATANQKVLLIVTVLSNDVVLADI